jgi:hypothetical protein
MGTISEKIIEKLDSLYKKVDEDHQGILSEITVCKEHIAELQKINIQLDKLEEKVDYLQSFPKEKEKEYIKLVEKLTKEKGKEIPTTKVIEKPERANVFKPLGKLLHVSISMPVLEQSTSLTKITFEKPTVLKGTKEIKRDAKMLSIFKKKKEVQLINAEEFEFNEIEERVRNASIPKFEFRQIYKRGNF